MTSSNFIKQILGDVKDALNVAENANVNRDFTAVQNLDIVRVDAYYKNIDAVTNNDVTIRTTFNNVLATKENKLKAIKKLEVHLKNLTKKIKEEEK